MLTNDTMIPNRYGQWAKARKLYRQIQDTLTTGGIVTVATYTRATHYDRRHVDMFKIVLSHIYVQRGKHWDCIDYCGIRFTR